MIVQSFRSASLLAALFIGAATVPSSLSAQHRAIDDRGSSTTLVRMVPAFARVDTVQQVSAAGPRVAPVAFTAQAVAPLADPARPIRDSRSSDNTNVATMAVGAAAVGLGLIIGGDGGTIVAVTGGVIGLVGLYRYLR